MRLIAMAEFKAPFSVLRRATIIDAVALGIAARRVTSMEAECQTLANIVQRLAGQSPPHDFTLIVTLDSASGIVSGFPAFTGNDLIASD